MNKLFEITLDYTGIDGVEYDVDLQKKAMQKMLDEVKIDGKKIDVKIVNMIDYHNCYSATFRGTMDDLKKMMLAYFCSDEDEFNEYVEDDMFEEVK